jgi:hypothetical protein
VIQLLKSRWTYVTIRVVGFSLLVGYLAVTADWRISVPWVFAFPAISFSVAWLFVGLNLFDRFPKLNRYILYPQTNGNTERAQSDNEWALSQAKYLGSGGKSVVFAPTEDGLICVPVLLVGIGTISAALGGLAYGLIHLGRFTYLECIGKTITYTLVCYFVLPQGLLTVVTGHLLMDLIAFAALKVAKYKLSAELRSNPHQSRGTRARAARAPHRER